MLEISRLKKQYGSTVILSVPLLSFDNGVYWIKGGNGSGKTTLLKMIAGLLPFEGSIRLNEFDLKKNPVEYRRYVNYAEAEPLFPSFITGEDLIMLFQKAKKGNANEVQRLIDTFNIQSFIPNPVGTYSSGMVKKLSLILAFIGQPKVILLDEPLVTLEDHSIPILTELISDYQQNKQVTFLITSHQLLEHYSLGNIKTILVKDQTACFQ
jgi:ABC-2 type transport system ATP-binding protein